MVGDSEESLRARSYVVGRARYDSNPRGVLIGDDGGLLKLLFSVPERRLLGVHIVGEQASELIAPGLIALTMGATTDTFIDACFNYPTLSDMYKYAAYDALGRLDRGETWGALPRGCRTTSASEFPPDSRASNRSACSSTKAIGWSLLKVG